MTFKTIKLGTFLFTFLNVIRPFEIGRLSNNLKFKNAVTQFHYMSIFRICVKYTQILYFKARIPFLNLCNIKLFKINEYCRFEN